MLRGKSFFRLINQRLLKHSPESFDAKMFVFCSVTSCKRSCSFGVAGRETQVYRVCNTVGWCMDSGGDTGGGQEKVCGWLLVCPSKNPFARVPELSSSSFLFSSTFSKSCIDSKKGGSFALHKKHPSRKNVQTMDFSGN